MKKRIIEVIPYNPQYPEIFLKESELILSVLKPEILSIYHIGSTAIEGIYSKPIVDVMVVVKDIEKIDDYNHCMSNLNYEARGELGIAGRRYFQKLDDEGNHLFHIHIYEKGSIYIDRHLKFIKHLNNNLKDKKEYEKLKIGLAKEFRYDRSSYTEGKSEFINKILRKLGL